MERFAFKIAFFLLGLLSTTAQIVFTRELLVVAYGNETVLAFIFFAWFLSIGIGAYTATALPGKLFKKSLFFLIFAALSLLPSIEVFIIRSIRIYADIPPGESLSIPMILLFTFFTILPFAFLIGLIFPIASKITQTSFKRFKDKPQISAGFVYTLESLGSMSAGIAASLFLLRFFDHVTVLLSITIIFATTVIFYATSISMKRSSKALIALLAITFTIFYSISLKELDVKSLQQRWRSLSFQKKVLETHSPYQNIALGKNEAGYSVYGNGNFINSFPDPFTPESTSHLFLSLHPNPKNILFSSEVGEESVEHLLKHNPERIDYVSLDPKLHKIVLPLLPQNARKALTDKRVETIMEDLRAYVKKVKDKYDVIISLSPDPTTLSLNRFYTRNFFQDIEKILTNTGIFIISVSSTENYLAGDVGEYLGSVYKTLSTVFKDILVLPGARAYIVCSKNLNGIGKNPGKIIERFNSRKIESKYFKGENLSVYLEEYRIKKAKEVLNKNLPFYELNTDYNPKTFLYNLKIIAGYSDKTSLKLIDFFNKLNPFVYLSLIILFTLSRFIYSILRYRGPVNLKKFNSAWTIFTTGLTGFSLQLILLYLYQSTYGYIYKMIGMVVGIFMFGLFLGSFTGNKIKVSADKNPLRLITSIEIITALFTLVLPFVFKLIPHEPTIMILALICGFLTGFEFPLANKIYYKETNLIKASSVIDSLDHIGSAIGALLCGLLMVPTLGITTTCIILFALKLSSATLWGQAILFKNIKIELVD